MSNSQAIYKEKTIESAINTIITKMQDIYGLPEEDREQSRRRWIWELIQNASDCAKEDKVSIKIEVTKNRLKFSHNGSIFTYKNLVDLITQISSKRTQEEQTGKFGTGFISTHLISPIVNIDGIYHSDEKSTDYKKLNLCIDRSNLDQYYIKNNIEKALNDLDELDAQPNLYNSLEKGFHTNFIYDIESNADIQQSIEIGLKDLDRCIGYVFAFNKKIEEVQYNNYVYSMDSIEYTDNSISKVIVKKTNTDEIDLKTILTCCGDENLILATEVTKEQKEYACKDTTTIPRLFCTFPLIGTEKFAFPVIINSSKLEISQERNSVHESKNNESIICEAIQLYDQLLKYANENDYKTIYNICKMHKPNNRNSWHEIIFSKIENIYLNKGIIPCIDSSGMQRKVKLKSDEKFNLIVPYMEEKDNRDEFWELIHTLKTKPQPLKSEYVEWVKLLTPAIINPQSIFKCLLNEEKSSLATLENRFSTWPDMFKWLNAFYGLCVKSNIDLVTLPNQKGEFADISKLKSDKDIDEKLKDILLHLSGIDIRTSLINKEINLNNILLKYPSIVVYDNQFVAKKIAEKVREHISKEGAGEKRTPETQKIFNELTDWFECNPEVSKELFKDIYESRFQLTTKEETIRRLEVATKVEQAISENNIAFETALSVIQNSAQIIKLIENGEIVVNEEDTRKLFQHISSSSPYAKEKIDSMIERSISEIHKELENNPNYSVAHDLQQWKQEKYATTVFKAIRNKDNVDIRIIIRPSDGNKIIFYEDTELDALDDIDYELWTCDENCNVKMLTLGDILKTTGINVIPLRKI